MADDDNAADRRLGGPSSAQNLPWHGTNPPVFLVDRLPERAHTVLDGAEGRHAATVRRLRVGERLLLGDGRGGLAHCAVRAVEQQTLRLDVLDSWTQQRPHPRVVLVQALLKGDRGELAVEQATEAGADVIVPWRAARCVARWDDGARGAKALGKWRSTATQAAKQARRAWVPEVGEPVRTSELAELVRGAAGALVLHESAADPLPDLPLPTDGDLLLVVGPEGGVAADELAELTGAGAVPARLGGSVLRASTAAAVALGAVGVLTSRWADEHRSARSNSPDAAPGS